MSDTDEFFIGWQGKAPEKTKKFIRGRSLAFVIAGIGVALVLASLQQTIGRAWFEFGNVREFNGILVESPVPMLLAESPDEQSGESVYLLVNPFKYGYPEETAREFHLKPVTIKGTLIYNESGGAMLEVVETLPREETETNIALPTVVEEKEVELSGEIVDSKCWLGVMNPGALKAHRACAINCIRGGIPPVLLVDRKDFYILVGPDGEAINQAVLEHVALPITVKGKAIDYGSLRVFKIDPSAIELTHSS